MFSIKGIYQDGVARPVRPLKARDGQRVIITFLEEACEEASITEDDADWEAMMQLVQAHAVETGIEDLAHEHDHYLHHKPKKASS